MTTKTKLTAKASAVIVNTAIEKAANSTKVMRNDIQVASIAVLMHAERFGDYTLANSLVMAVAEGTNIKSLVVWFEQYGGLIIDDSNADLGFTSWKGAQFIKDNFQDAKAKNWWTCKPMTPFKGYDLMSELERLVTMAAKKAAEQRKYENDGDVEKLDAMSIDATLLHALSELTKTHGGTVKLTQSDNAKTVKDVSSTAPKKTTQEPKAA